MKNLIRKEILMLQNEVKNLSVQKKSERILFELKMAQICVLEKILKGGNKMGQADELQKGFVNVLIDIEGYLLDNNSKDCLDYVLKVKKEILDDIN